MHRSSLCAVATGIFDYALTKCAIPQALASALTPHSSENPYAYILPSGETITLASAKRVLVIATGKAGATMLAAFLRHVHLPSQVHVEGVLIAPESLPNLPSSIAYFAGGHPLPNQQSFAGARAVLSLLLDASSAARPGDTFCFFLISGGASAMLELPLDSAISLEDTVALYRSLVHSGASIAEINCVRKHFSAIKGGRLGLAAAAIPNLTILVSDVPAGHLDALGSGPTIPDTSTVADCLAVLHRHRLLEQLSPLVRSFFTSTALPETPKSYPVAPRVLTLLSSDDLAEAAREQAETLGFHTVIDNTCDDWDYRAATKHLLARLRELRRHHTRVCVISVGELSVLVALPQGQLPGTGGRNQHFALHAATLLQPYDNNTAVLSAGSDGVDGNSRFAGAVVGGDTLNPLSGLTLPDALRALARYDSSPLLETLNATIHTGATGNNLRDLRILLASTEPLARTE